MEALGLSGEVFASKAKFSRSFWFEPPVRLNGDVVDPAVPLQVGAFTYIQKFCRYRAAEIGRYCSIAPSVIIGEPSHPMDRITTSPLTYSNGIAGFDSWYFDKSPAKRKVLAYKQRLPKTIIGHDVWIGEGAFIRAGLTIGQGAVIGARSVVTKDVPPYHIVAGIPAKTLRLRFPERTIERLLASNWWRYAVPDFSTAELGDPEKAMDLIAERASAGLLTPYEPEPITPENVRAKCADA